MNARLVVIFCAFISFQALAQSDDKPNVLLILIDDLRPVLSSFAGPVSTPNLDQIAERGFRFANNYANVPVCGASRASMMSGLAPTSSRFLTFNSRLDQDVPGAESLPGIFKRHGWRSVGYGKIFDVIDDSSTSWSVPVWSPPMQWYGSVPEGARGEHLQKSYLEPLVAGRPPYMERLQVDDTAYPDGQIAAKVAADIPVLAADERPFFLAVGFRKPHLPFNVPAKYWSEEKKDPSYLPGTWRSIGSDLPASARHRSLELYMQYDALPIIGELGDVAAIEIVAGYYAAVRSIDAQVGLVLDALKAADVDDNTIIVVAGDHGYFLGEQRMWTKHALFETALRTPLIVSDPRQSGGYEVRAVTDLLDLFPTLIDLADIEATQELDGVSLVPLMADPNQDRHPEKPESISRWLNGESIRNERYRYSAWYDNLGRITDEMLFDLANDPMETANIAELGIGTVKELRAKLDAKRVGPIWSPELDRWSGRASGQVSDWTLVVGILTRYPSIVVIWVCVFVFIAVGIFGFRYRKSQGKRV